MPDELAAAVDERLAQRIEAARERLDRQAADRTDRTRRRTAGLRSRHATKLARATRRRT